MLDSNRLDGKVAVITGAGGEIGAATARLMAARGAHIVAVDKDGASLKRLGADLALHGRFLAIQADVTDEASVEGYARRARDEMGAIHVFFNNAGIEGIVRPLTEMPLAEFQRVLNVNVVGVFLGLKHVMPIMAANGGGSIINTSSVAGVVGHPGIAPYIASKHAVIGLTRTAAAEGAPKGIRVNCVNPGPIESRMMASLEEGFAPGGASSDRQERGGAIPLRRYGLPEEVAALVAFLASDDARYITGAVHMIDGGMTAI